MRIKINLFLIANKYLFGILRLKFPYQVLQEIFRSSDICNRTAISFFLKKQRLTVRTNITIKSGAIHLSTSLVTVPSGNSLKGVAMAKEPTQIRGLY